jgi:hypothetical protein
MSAAYDIHSDMKVAVALLAQSIVTNTTTVGAIIDTEGLEGLEFTLSSATITDGVYVVLLEDSDDSGMSGATTVAGDDLLGNNPRFILTDDDDVSRVGYVGNKRFVRLSVVSTGVTTGGAFSATAIQTMAKHQPVAEQDGTQP